MSNQPETALHLRLILSGQKIGAVELSSNRAVMAGRVLCGRSTSEALSLLPLLFSLCGTAQLQAALAACEAACGITPSPAQATARRMLLLAEAVSEHSTQILRDWPILLGEAPRLEAVRSLRQILSSLRAELYAAAWAHLGGAALTADEHHLRLILSEAEQILREAVFGGAPEEALADRDAFARWSSRPSTAPARLIDHVGGALAGFGAADGMLMTGNPAELEPLLAMDRQDAFLSAPHWRGATAETGPLARRRAHPLVARLLADHGTGLLPRFAARLVEVAEDLREMQALAATIRSDPGHSGETGATGSGFGWVEATRGLLAHRVELVEGKVTRYQILAPTEWNFHPQGPLARGLTGAAAADAAEAGHRARLLVAALDPCVACAVEVTDNA